MLAGIMEDAVRMKYSTKKLFLLCCLLPGFALGSQPAPSYATQQSNVLPCDVPNYGARASIALEAKEPPNLRGYGFYLFYDPQRFQWRRFNVYFDVGYNHFWDTKTPVYTSVSIYAIAPVVRYTFRPRGIVTPFLELSVGLSYLNHTHFQERNLGIHFAFQDRIGVGVLLGPYNKMTIGVHAVHYSNAKFADRNAGISVPVMLDIGYRFN